METLVGKMLSDLAQIAERKWYAGMMILGFALIVWAIAGAPVDRLALGLIGIAMAGIAIGEAETRTYRERITGGMGSLWKVRWPVRQITFWALVFCATGILALIGAILRIRAAHGDWLIAALGI